MSNNESSKMEKNALLVFLLLAGLIYLFGMYYSFSSGHILAGNLLIAVIVLLTGLVTWANRSKT